MADSDSSSIYSPPPEKIMNPYDRRGSARPPSTSRSIGAFVIYGDEEGNTAQMQWRGSFCDNDDGGNPSEVLQDNQLQLSPPEIKGAYVVYEDNKGGAKEMRWRESFSEDENEGEMRNKINDKAGLPSPTFILMLTLK